MLVFIIVDTKLFVNYGNLPNTRFNGNSWTSLKLLVCHFDPNQVYLIHIDIGAILDTIVGKPCILHRRLHFVNKQILWDCLSNSKSKCLFLPPVFWNNDQSELTPADEVAESIQAMLPIRFNQTLHTNLSYAGSHVWRMLSVHLFFPQNIQIYVSLTVSILYIVCISHMQVSPMGHHFARSEIRNVCVQWHICTLNRFDLVHKSLYALAKFELWGI